MTSNFLLRTFILLCVLCCAASSFALDRNAFTFTKYDVEVRLDPESHQLAARGKITLRNDSTEPQKNTALQISSTLDWRMIELDGQELEYIAQPYSTDIDHTGAVNEANIKLPNAVAPKQSIELEVGYSGSIEVSTDRLKRLETPQSAADASEWDQIGQPFTALRGIGYVLWYPAAMPAVNLSAGELSSAIGKWQLREQNSQMLLKACWIAPQDHRLTVLSNGEFEGIGADSEQEDANTGCSSFRFATLNNTVPMLALGEFQVLQRPQMNLYYLGDTTKSDAEDFALAAEKVRPMTTEWFGEPRSTLQVIDLPVPNGNPFESGTTLITPFKMDPRVTELTMAHSWVHASFTSPRPWIDEGLAHFAQALQRERQDGKKAAIAYLQARLPALLIDPTDQQSPNSAANALANTVDDNIYRNKGMYVWWMLRDMLGDHAVQAAIASYRPEKDKEQSYMQRLLQAQTKQNLEWFFDDWVYRDRGLPDLRIDAATPRETLNGAFIVAVTVENLGTATANVPVIVRGENGESSARLQVGPKQIETTRVAVQGKPQQVTVNDGSIPEVQPGVHVFKFPIPADESSSSSK